MGLPLAIFNSGPYTHPLHGDAALACEQPAEQEERPYKCKQCPRSYRHAGSLVNHRHTHEVGLFHCLVCRKDFSNPMALKSHLRTHLEEKRHKCLDCGRGFRTSSQLANHRCVARLNQEQEEKEESNGDSCTFQKVQDISSSDGDACSGMEGSSRSLLTNLEKYIAESVVPADFSQLGFPIKMEKETEERATEDERHTLGVYQCAMCFKAFSNLMALKSHTRLHSEYRPYKCRFCHKAFRLPSELLSHQKAHNQDESKMTGLPAWEGSEHNGAAFPGLLPSGDELSDSFHVLEEDALPNGWQSQVPSPLSGDTEVTPYLCDQCGLDFNQASSLVIHKQTH
uniref:Zinc finger protein 646 n=1 Tax=Anolis carolinensis TaxID=28377 RepID=H9GS97_ANOCA